MAKQSRALAIVKTTRKVTGTFNTFKSLYGTSGLIALIKKDLSNAKAYADQSLVHYAEAGLKLLMAREIILVEIKEGRKERGYWGEWLAANFHLGMRSAQQYMVAGKRLSDPNFKFETLENQTLSDTRGDKRDNHHSKSSKDVAEKLNTLDLEVYQAPAENKVVQLKRELALRLIDIGFNTLRSRMHPEHKGGSIEAFRMLQDVADQLRDATIN